MTKPKNYWTKERCQEEALKYSHRTEMHKKSTISYQKARKNGWLDEICSHMIQQMKPKGHWDKENCRLEALKYNTIKDFRINSSSSYRMALKMDWLNEISSHMIFTKKPKGYWTKEKCREEALKYNNRQDFRKNSKLVCEKSYTKGWLDEICSHMTQNINESKRCIYAHEFTDNYVYIGLTNNYKKRNKDHNRDENSQVFKHIKKTNLIPSTIQLTEYLDVNIAKEKEEYYVNQYKENGWFILNVAKTGALGSNITMWTKEKCKEEALKYDYRKVFSNESCSAYNSARKNKWLNDICSHMKNGRIKS